MILHIKYVFRIVFEFSSFGVTVYLTIQNFGHFSYLKLVHTLLYVVNFPLINIRGNYHYHFYKLYYTFNKKRPKFSSLVFRSKKNNIIKKNECTSEKYVEMNI